MRLSIQRHLKLISKTLGKIEKGSVKQDSLTIAQINATIITIFIVVFTAFAGYYLNILREKKIVVFNDADRINSLDFPISYVSPSSSFPFPKDADDSEELASLMRNLVDCVGYKSPHEIVIAEDIVDRAKGIYSIMNVVSHRYPFPEYPIEKSNVFNKTTEIPIENIEYIRKWRKDLQKVCRALYLPVEMLVNRPQIGDALLKSDSNFIFAMRRLKAEKEFGRTDLHSVERDFRNKLKKALEISNSVKHSLRDYDGLRKTLPRELNIVLFVFFGIISFICGVIYPIVSPRPKAKYYIWIPILFTLLILIYVIFMINPNPAKLAYSNAKLAYFKAKQAVFRTKHASFMGLGDLPGGIYSSNAKGVSPDGSIVVGNSISSAGIEAFRWSKSTGMRGIGDLSGGKFESVARATSTNGSTIVGRGTSIKSSPNEEAFRWTEATGMVGLGDLQGKPFRSDAYSISADGSLIVGRSWVTGSDQKAFLWSKADGMVDLGYLPGGGNVSEAYGISGDGLVVVGWSASENRLEAFRWTKSTGMVGLGGFSSGADGIVNARSFAYNVSADGSTIVGRAGVCGKAFRWKKETGMVAISGCNGRANAASNDGSRVVGQAISLGVKEAIIWDETNGTRKLEEFLTNDLGIDLMGFKLQEACDISDDGTVIVGWGTNSKGFQEAWIVKINPAPTTRLIWLLISGFIVISIFIGLFIYRRKIKR